MRVFLPTLPLSAVALAVSLALSACGGDSPDKLLASARQYLEKNDTNAASIELKNALAKDPNLAEARFLLGKTLLESGDAVGAEVELAKALDLKYSADAVAVQMSRSLLVRAQFKKVLDDYAKLEPSDAGQRAELKTNIAVANAALGKQAEAEAAFAAAVAAKSDHAPALLGQARLKVAARDLSGAMTLIDSVLAKNDKDIDALMFKAGLQSFNGDKAAAQALFRKVVELKPAYAPAHTSLIMADLQEGRLDSAQKQLDAMQKVLPKNPQTYYVQGMLGLQQKNLTVAREAAQTLLKMATNDPRALQLAGMVEFEARADLQAQEYLSQAVARAPELELARRMLIRSYLRTGQTNKAIAALQPALQEDKPAAVMLTLAGEVYMQAGDPGKAESYFTRANAMEPGNAANRTALAIIHTTKGETERGIAELEQIAADDKGVSADMALIAASMGQKRFDQALKAIATLEKKQPDNLMVHNLRAGALHGKGDIAGARKSLEKALTVNPAYFPAAAALARLDLEDRKPDQAAQRFEAVLAKDPKSVQSLLALAELKSRQSGGESKAVELIRQAISVAPNDAVARVALINFQLAAKDAKGAMSAAQDALLALPDRPEVLDAAGRAMQENGDYNQALTVYSKLATLLPNSPQSYLRMAEVNMAAKNREAARESVNKGLQLQPDSLPLQRAAIALDLEAKRYTEALTRTRAMQKQQPKQNVGYLLEGDVHAAQRAWPEAANAYRNGLKAAESTELNIRLHSALVAAGQAAEATKVADGWLKSHAKDHAFRMYLSGLAVSKKDYAAAAALQKRVLDDQPNNAAVMNDYAWTLGKLGDPKALALAEQANKLAPNQPALMDTLAMLLVEKGQAARGVEILRKAVELAPQAAEIRVNFARALLKSGDKSSARKELDTVAKLGDKYPNQAEVAELLKGL